MQHAGIVLELETRNALVLDRDGRFVRIPRSSNMQIGAEVAWSESERHPTVPHRRAWKTPLWRRAGAAGIAACLVAAAGFWFARGAFTPTAYAYVSLDINPSVSMQVDQHMRVLHADGLNADGQLILKGLHLRGQSLKEAVSMVVDASVTHHMMPQGDAILVSAAPTVSDADVGKVEEQAQDGVRQAIASSSAATSLSPKVYAIGLSNAVWAAANQAHVSPGKLAAYLMAAKEGMHVTSVNQLTGPQLNQVLSDVDGQAVTQVLKVNDPKEIAKLIQELQQAGMLAAVAPTVAAPTPNKPGPSGGNGPKPGTHKANPGSPGQHKHETSEVATVHIGGTTITIPTGSVGPGQAPTDERNPDHSLNTDRDVEHSASHDEQPPANWQGDSRDEDDNHDGSGSSEWPSAKNAVGNVGSTVTDLP